MDIRKFLLLLELEPPLTPLEVHRAYRRMVKRWHPDQFALQPEILALAQERLKAINEAYTIVKKCTEAQLSSALHPAGVQDAAGSTPTPQGKPMGPAAPPQAQHRQYRTRPAGAAHRQQTAPPCGSPIGRPSSAARKPAPNFERVLKEAGRTSASSSNQGKAGARPYPGIRPIRRPCSNLRMEGTAPISPIRPVRPISRIRPIGESE